MTAQKQSSDLREILGEVSQALARLDADRLEEIALSCEELVGECLSQKELRRNQIRIDFRRVERDMGVFKRLLELTNANLTFMRGLRSMRGRRLEYGRVPANMCPTAEVEYGNH